MIFNRFAILKTLRTVDVTLPATHCAERLPAATAVDWHHAPLDRRPNPITCSCKVLTFEGGLIPEFIVRISAKDCQILQVKVWGM